MRYSLTYFPPLSFQDGENYVGKLYDDVTLPVRESSMVVLDVVCDVMYVLPRSRKVFTTNLP